MPKQISLSFLRELGDALRKGRVSKGLTQRALGERVGLPQSHISKIEQGGVDLQLSSLVEMARALDLELKLVPRQALPAVDALIHASGPDDSEQSTRRAREIIAVHEQLARSLTTAFPNLDEALTFQTMLRMIQGHRFDPAAFKILKTALAPTRKIADAFRNGDITRRQLIVTLERINKGLRALRKTLGQGVRMTAPRQVPAHSLEDDDDD
ncbi:helix-turn-helix domain-containing protein [Sphingomonas crocodyli]|uniref:XRE family transcriptional regulator n=1 Tax=Sphingomonas crocodyli TaxID=1979270 RepID=A0A437LY25_9SPHN|nr:helix-turn-helix transcriptional regulator [Sphingomonas crocodyli]RVT90264.1 XRE family transcriptional regulator [Sphingomonas crocodyli]